KFRQKLTEQNTGFNPLLEESIARQWRLAEPLPVRMDLGHIRQKIIELQRGTGMDSAVLMFLALATAVLAAVLLVLLIEFLSRRKRQNPKPRHAHKHRVHSASRHS